MIPEPVVKWFIDLVRRSLETDGAEAKTQTPALTLILTGVSIFAILTVIVLYKRRTS